MSKTTNNQRYAFIDFMRGQAILLMFIYHFCFGLAQIGLIDARFSSDYFWIGFRTLIIFLFLSLVGLGLYLSKHTNTFTLRYCKRMLLLALYAAIITWVSYLVRPNYYVYFGILHHIIIASLVGLLFVTFYRVNLILGLAALFLGVFVENSWFNSAYTHWLGLGNAKILSDDFAPLFPWFGFVLIGLFMANYLFKQQQLARFRKHYIEDWRPQTFVGKTFCWAGRQSLHLYFVHFISFYVAVYIFS